MHPSYDHTIADQQRVFQIASMKMRTIAICCARTPHSRQPVIGCIRGGVQPTHDESIGKIRRRDLYRIAKAWPGSSRPTKRLLKRSFRYRDIDEVHGSQVGEWLL